MNEFRFFTTMIKIKNKKNNKVDVNRRIIKNEKE